MAVSNPMSVLLNFKAPVAETLIYHGLKIIFLESTVHTYISSPY